MTNALLNRIARSLTALGESGSDALLANMTLMQYCVQDMFKGRQIPNIAKNVAKKFSGGENMFLGPGVLSIDPQQLEAALWKYVGQAVASAAAKVKAGKEHYAIDGIVQQFRIDAKYRDKVKSAAVAAIGRDIFANDGVAESKLVLTFANKHARNRADDEVLTAFSDVVDRGELETRQKHTQPNVLYVLGKYADSVPQFLKRDTRIQFTSKVEESRLTPAIWHREFNDGFYRVRSGVNEMAATYVPITREEFESWLSEIWGAGNWNIRAGSVGVYRLKLGPKVSLEVSSSIGRADTNMGVGEGAIHVAMVGRVSGRVLNKKATGKSRINRTKGWKGNLLAALKALEAAYKASPMFYEAIADPESYKDEMLGRIASIPGSDSSEFWKSLRDFVASGRVLSDKQAAILMRETPSYKHTASSRTSTPTPQQIRQIVKLQARDYNRDTGGGRWDNFG